MHEDLIAKARSVLHRPACSFGCVNCNRVEKRRGRVLRPLWPRLTFAATGASTRFLFVLLRGGLDGLESVPPYGDPGHQAIRGALALSPPAATPMTGLTRSSHTTG
ncbi:hypothetical protein CDEF62S_01987 [Castellaniella defragrans]